MFPLGRKILNREKTGRKAPKESVRLVLGDKNREWEQVETMLFPFS